MSTVAEPRRRSIPVALFAEMRPQQWTKNVLLFPALPLSLILLSAFVFLILLMLMVANQKFEFLAASAAAGIGTIIGAVVMRRRAEGGEIPQLGLNDPYLVAFLRGGANEVARLATISLIERNLLKAEGQKLVSVQPVEFSSVKDPLERRILGLFTGGGEAKALFSDEQIKAYCDEYRRELEYHGLLPDERVQNARKVRLGLCLLMILGVALTKILVAISQGHFNLGFTVLMAAFFSIVLAVIAFPRRTTRGDRFLSDLRTIYQASRQQVPMLQSAGAGDQVLMLSAVYGFAALPLGTYPYAKELFPAAASTTPSAGCGSSCGSSCGGGSGCGGGGCGGGCGG